MQKSVYFLGNFRMLQALKQADVNIENAIKIENIMCLYLSFMITLCILYLKLYLYKLSIISIFYKSTHLN